MPNNPFIGHIQLFAGNFAPRGWAFCQGQLLPIAQNTALFSILGTTYGGDGETTFGLPDFQGRMAISQGRGPGLPTYRLGQKSGNATTQLTAANLPQSQIGFGASDDDGTSTNGTNRVLATPNDDRALYTSEDATGNLSPGAISGAQSTAFSNQPPYLALNYIIALDGIYPSES